MTENHEGVKRISLAPSETGGFARNSAIAGRSSAVVACWYDPAVVAASFGLCAGMWTKEKVERAFLSTTSFVRYDGSTRIRRSVLVSLPRRRVRHAQTDGDYDRFSLTTFSPSGQSRSPAYSRTRLDRAVMTMAVARKGGR